MVLGKHLIFNGSIGKPVCQQLQYSLEISEMKFYTYGLKG